MTTATTPSKKDQDWADISDDEEEEPVPIVKVDTDSLDHSLPHRQRQEIGGAFVGNGFRD